MDELIDGMWTRRVDVFCDGCGAAIPENISPISLRDGSLLCPTCERRVRIRFPKMGREDPLKLLSLPDYLREREEIGEYRESLRKRYEGADAVFVAEEIKHQGPFCTHPPGGYMGGSSMESFTVETWPWQKMLGGKRW